MARRLAAVAGFYRYAVEAGALERSPVPDRRRLVVDDTSTSLGVSEAELRALITAAAAVGRDAAALVLLLGLNGLRVSEAVDRDVTDLGTARGHRTLRLVRKGGKIRVAPLAPPTARAVDACAAGRDSGPLLRSRTGARLHRSGAWRLLRKVARTAGLSEEVVGRLHPHDLRHAFVTLALDAGASLRDVQDAAGHADPRTTRRYDRNRHSLDRHPTYRLAGLAGSGPTGDPPTEQQPGVGHPDDDGRQEPT